MIYNDQYVPINTNNWL